MSPTTNIKIVNWDQKRSQEDGEDRSTLLYQLERKYFSDEQQTVDSSIVIAIYGTSPCQAATEGDLKAVVLDDLEITCVGDLSRFRKLVQNVDDLDLSYNKISSWSTVNDLFESLPSLKSLNLSHNPLSQLFLNAISEAPQLSTFILNGIDLPFNHILSFLYRMPSLKELHLSYNDFNNVSIKGFKENSNTNIVFPTLSILYLVRCNFNKWVDVIYVLRCFSNIKSLFLSENPLESVEKKVSINNEAIITGQLLKSLHTLMLSDTLLASWCSIENLKEIPGLQELRCSNIPFLKEFSQEEKRHLVVGRLSNLRTLNGSIITDFQREGSERFFIRYYQNAENKPAVYDCLVAKHGELEQLVRVDLTPNSFARVLICCEETGYENWERIKLRNTVGLFMRLIEKKTSIPKKKMRLFYYDANVYALGPQELRFPNQVLQTLHIEDGDKFIVMVRI